jgi:hypothetical protein
MQKLVLYGSLVLLAIWSCSKDKFEDKPNIKIKSINPTQVPLQSQMVMDLEFTDKQGDLDSVFVFKKRLNSIQKPLNNANYFNFKLPTFPEKPKGEIQLTFRYNEDLIAAVTPNNQPGAPNDKEPDTLVFNIVVKDKKGNTSDTTTTDKIVIERY